MWKKFLVNIAHVSAVIVVLCRMGFYKWIPTACDTPTFVNFDSFISDEIEHSGICSCGNFIDFDEFRVSSNGCGFQRVFIR